MPRPQCEFYTAKFTRCTRSCDVGTHYCRTHIPKAEVLLMVGPRPAEGHCLCARRVAGQEQWCGQPYREGETVCQWHWERMEIRAEDERRRRERREELGLLTEVTVQAYLNQNPQQPWEEVTRQIRWRMSRPHGAMEFLPVGVGFDVARLYFRLTTQDEVPIGVFTQFWVNVWQVAHDGLWIAEAPPAADQVPPPPPPLAGMARLAMDTQNVHTAVVAKQTNSNVDLLLEITPTEGMDTLTTLTRWWMDMSPRPDFETYWKVMEDVRHWYGKRTCKSTSDYLYQRVLTGLISKISTMGDELFTELVKRIWEECAEAVGMCCEGHIGRLANVLVGFDDAFRPPVPVGEILQTKMAAIAEMKLSHKLKLQKAIAVMDELKIPIPDRAPWLEALEE